ncbi:S-ribosylhomocysteine lyase, partial [Enterococcus faecalis]|uniref:S-ribosylhomocysteine lyase n=1 Tax=Enterococcus faecalis TaxID=1351 RepID=UPI003CC680E6
KYDFRFLLPNKDALQTGAFQTLEHLLAVNMRDELKGIIDFSPMGCRTGFYYIIWVQQSTQENRDAYFNLLNKLIKTEVVPSVSGKKCG